MEKNQTIEERTQKIMEYLTQIYFNKETIDVNQLFAIALYLYQNANLGPRGTKKVAGYLVKLSNITKEFSITNLDNHHNIREKKEEIETIFRRINKCIDYRKICQYVLTNAKKTLECADKTVTTGNFVYDAYHDMLLQSCTQLGLNCQQKEYSNIYFRTKDVLELLQLNRTKQEAIIRNAMNAQARLKVLLNVSQSAKNKIRYEGMICELDYAIEEIQYQKMQEETIYANAAFAQATRSAGYQKQIVKEIINLDRQRNV